MAEQQNHHIRIKIGDAEFEASGAPDQVQSQYDAFIAQHQAHLAGFAAMKRPDKPTKLQVSTENDPRIDNDALAEAAARAFSTDGDMVSLNVLPRTPNAQADALLMILWGYEHLRGEHTVMATEFMRAAKRSGIQIDRIDRIIAPNQQYYVRGGSRKGARYSLNNPGRIQAEKLVREQFQ